jgi:ATP-binding cassette subfamily B protein
MSSATRPGIGQLAPLLPFLKDHRGKLGLGFLFMVVQNYFYMKIPQQVQMMVDETVAANRGDVILRALLGLGVYTAVMAVSLFAMRALIIGVSREIEYSLRDRIYTGLLGKPLSFHNRYTTGDLISRSSNDLSDVRLLLGPGIMYIPNSISRLAFFFPVLLSLSPRLLAWVGGVLLLLIALITLLLPRLRPLYLETQQETGRLNEQVWQTLSGRTTISLFQSEGTFVKRFAGSLDRYHRTQMRLVKRKEVLWPIFIFIFSLTEALTLLIGGRAVMAGAMTLGELLQFNLMIGFLAFPVFSIGWVMSSLQQGITAMSRINVLLEAGDTPLSPLEPGAGESLRQVSMRDLTFAYEGGQEPVLSGINLELREGEILGLTGTVASGKTTLLRILGGLESPGPGTLFFDDRDAKELGTRLQMASVSYVTENPFLFSRSIRENIALGHEEVDEDRIRQVADMAGLMPDLERFPDGLDQVIGERGLTLSGGQRQRVGLARALYRRSPLLLLDDPLSHVDAETETRILGHLSRVPWVRMIVLVSHRISTLKMAQRIAVLERGALCESGTHRELIARGGLYAHLAELQRLKGD